MLLVSLINNIIEQAGFIIWLACFMTRLQNILTTKDCTFAAHVQYASRITTIQLTTAEIDLRFTAALWARKWISPSPSPYISLYNCS
jgi:hypothetical protein